MEQCQKSMEKKNWGSQGYDDLYDIFHVIIAICETNKFEMS